MSKIELKNIHKDFSGKKVIQDVSLSVNSGELISLLGPSGCGKSTTLKIIAGIEKPLSGDVLIDGKSLLNVPMEKRKTVIVFQDHLLFPHMNVEENIEFGLKMSGMDKGLRRQKVNEIIELMELKGNEKKYPKELSGGQKQRVAIGRAIAAQPRVLLLDEPFSSLDINLRDTMRELISELQRKLRITTILVTHDHEEAFMMSSRVAVMLDGFIHQYDTPQNLYDKPSSIEVANFLGEKNYIEGKINNKIFICNLGNFEIDCEDNGNCKAMVKPENIGVSLDDRNKTALKGVILSRKYIGDRVYYTVKIEDKDLKCVQSSETLFEIGQQIAVSIDFTKAVFYKNN